MPNLSLNVEAVGPFRSRARAEAVATRVDVDLYGVDSSASNTAPQVVRLITEREAIDVARGATR